MAFPGKSSVAPHEQSRRERHPPQRPHHLSSRFPSNPNLYGCKAGMVAANAVARAVADVVAAPRSCGATELKFRENAFTVLEILKTQLNCTFHQKFGLMKGCTLSEGPTPATLKVLR